MNSTNPGTNGTTDGVSPGPSWIPEEKLLLGVGLGTALLFALCFIAVLGAVACRGQYVRKGRRGRRLKSSVSMAYSDFETFKAARSYRTPSTDLSIISSSSASLYATPIKMKSTPFRSPALHKTTPPATIMSSSSYTSNSSAGGNSRGGGGGGSGGVGGGGGGVNGYGSGNINQNRSEDETLKFGGWRYIEPMISINDLKSQSEYSTDSQATPKRGHRSNQRSSQDVGDPRAFATKMLSPDYTGKRHREDHTRKHKRNHEGQRGRKH